MRRLTLALLLLGAGTRAAPAAAQLPPMPVASAPPESVMTGFYAHLKAQDWTGTASYYDLEDITRFADIVNRFAQIPGAREGFIQGLGLSDSAFAALSPTELYARIMELGLKANPDVTEATRTTVYRILGRVEEDSTHLHLVVRGAATIKGMAFTVTEVRSFHRGAAGWRLSMPSTMQGLMIGLESAMQQTQ